MAAAEDKGVIPSAGIRRYRREDAAAVRRILRESPEAADWSEASFDETNRLEGVVTLVSERAGEVEGFIIARKISDEGEVMNLAVSQGHRGKGGGRELLEAVMADFKAGGVSHVYLEVRESNAVATAFYERQGFTRTGKRMGYYRDPEEAAVLLEKKLTG